MAESPRPTREQVDVDLLVVDSLTRARSRRAYLRPRRLLAKLIVRLGTEVRALRADIRALRTGWNRLYAVIKEPNIRPELAIESLRLMAEAQLAARTPSTEREAAIARMTDVATRRPDGSDFYVVPVPLGWLRALSVPAVPPSTRTVFVVLTQDRHSDPEVELFTDAERAVEVAEEHAAEMGWTDTEIPSSSNWLFAGSHPTESDTICVFPVEVETPAGTVTEVRTEWGVRWSDGIITVATDEAEARQTSSVQYGPGATMRREVSTVTSPWSEAS